MSNIITPNNLQMTICEDAMRIFQKVNFAFHSLVGCSASSDALQNNMDTLKSAMSYMKDFYNKLENSDYKNPLITLMMDETLTIISKCSDRFASIVKQMPINHSKIKMLLGLIIELDDFYDEYTARWLNITKDWNLNFFEREC